MLFSKNCLQKEYKGYLIIDKIKMNLGFYNIGDERNNLSNNIKLVLDKDGAIILAGYSGRNGAFNNLVLLKLKDEIIIKKYNVESKYKIKEIYFEKKDGHIKISKKKDENIIVLTTDSPGKNGYQLIIKGVSLY